MIVRHRSLLRLPMPHLAEERHRIGISLDIELSGGVLSRAMQACSEFAVGHAVWPDRSFRCELERVSVRAGGGKSRASARRAECPMTWSSARA